MTYGFIATVPAPIQAYDEVHAEILRAQGGRPTAGLILHLARATDDGYQIIEVWRSKEDSTRFNEEVVNPVVDRLLAGRPAPPSGPRIEEFDVHTLIVAATDPA